MVMRCWKCDMELADGTSTCIYCGAAQKRKPAVTETGKAMRILYDRYGAQEVLKNSAYLVNGLGDLTDDSKKLRNQIKMGMDAGLGRLYLEQLNLGTPDESFNNRIKLLLTEEAGLNEKTANEIAGYFDEMIGWRSLSTSSAEHVMPPQSDIPSKETLGYQEIDRNSGVTEKNEEIDRSKSEKIKAHKFYPYEIATFITIVVFFVLGLILNEDYNPSSYIDYLADAVVLIPLIMSFRVTDEMIRKEWIKGSLVLMGILLLLIIVSISDAVHRNWLMNELGAGGERYLWQKHLLIGDILFLAFSTPLFIQTIRHRILEKKKGKR